MATFDSTERGGTATTFVASVGATSEISIVATICGTLIEYCSLGRGRAWLFLFRRGIPATPLALPHSMIPPSTILLSLEYRHYGDISKGGNAQALLVASRPALRRRP